MSNRPSKLGDLGGERGSGAVLARAGNHRIADSNDGNPYHFCLPPRLKSPDLPPVFETRYTSWISIPLSSALVMSYTVKAATEAAVRASISTPVGPRML